MKNSITYERLAQGELSLPLDETERALVDELRTQDVEFLKRHPASSLKPVRRTSLWWIPAAAVLILLIPLNSPVERVKSANQTLLVFHQTASGNEMLSPGARLLAGETIQLAYLAPHRHVAILSLDGRGHVTNHLPLVGDQSVVTESERAELLPYSYRLDDAPSFETVILVTSARSFSLAPINERLEKWGGTGPLSLPQDLTYTLFRIAKKEAP